MPPPRSQLLPPAWVLTLFGAALVFWLITTLKELVVLLVVGYSIAYLIDPLLVALERRRVPRSVGVAIVFAGASLILTVLVLTAVPTIVREYRELTQRLPSYLELAKVRLAPYVTEVESLLAQGGIAEEGSPAQSLVENLPSVGAGALRGALTAVTTTLLGGYSLTLTLLNLALLPFIVFYLAVDWQRLHRAVLVLFPRRNQMRVRELTHEIDRYVSAFVRGQLTVGAILFFLYLIGLGAIVRIELWLLMAVIAGFGNLIPYLGFLIGIVLSSLMALVTYGDLWSVGYVWIVFAVVQFLEGTFITPYVVGSKVGISPLAIILALFAGGQLFGILGLFLAVPAAAILKVLLRELHQKVIVAEASPA